MSRSPARPPERLGTPRLLLRAWRTGDAAMLLDAMTESREALLAWIPWVLDGMDTLEGATARVERNAASFAAGTEFLYAIMPPDESRVLGGTGLHPRIGPGGVEVGYWIASPVTGRGYATEAAREMTRVALALPGIERVEIRCDPRNVASSLVPQRLGFTHVETLQDQVTKSGTVQDTVVWCAHVRAATTNPPAASGQAGC